MLLGYPNVFQKQTNNLVSNILARGMFFGNVQIYIYTYTLYNIYICQTNLYKASLGHQTEIPACLLHLSLDCGRCAICTLGVLVLVLCPSVVAQNTSYKPARTPFMDIYGMIPPIKECYIMIPIYL